MALSSLAVARGMATPRELSRGAQGSARARFGVIRLMRGHEVLGKRRSEAVSSNPIDHLPYGGRDGRQGEACEVRVETGACTHARVGQAVALAMVDDAPVRRSARSACTMQLSVSSLRPTRRRCGGRHVDEHMCLVDMASTGGSRPNRISLGTSPRCVCEALSRQRHHAWGRLSGCYRHG